MAKYAINGFGRIGRNVLRAMSQTELEKVVAIHDLTPIETTAHLLKYDSTQGKFNGTVEIKGEDILVVNGHEIKILGGMLGPDQLPWKELGVDVVLESTGLFTAREKAEGHITAGAKKVLISAPAKNPDLTFCIGINDVWRQFDTPAIPDGQVMPDEYRSNIETMILAVRDSVKGVFLLSPYYMEPNASDFMRARMDEYVAVCRELAEKYGCVFVDFQKLYADYCGVRHSSYIAWDRVHPNQVGATLMAREFLSHCGFDYNHRG